MISRPNVQNQQAAHKVAPSIWAGRVLLIIGSLLFVANAIYTGYLFVNSLTDPSVNWADPFTALVAGLRPAICIFMLIAAIAGVSFVLDKGPLISVAAFAAFVSLIVLVAAIILDVRKLSDGWDWQQFFIGLLDLELACVVYVLGWFFAKNWLD